MSAVMKPYADFDTTQLIRELAEYDGHSAWMFFEDIGLSDRLNERIWHGGADILRNLCRTWQRNPEAVYAICGAEFWQHMKHLAMERN